MAFYDRNKNGAMKTKLINTIAPSTYELKGSLTEHEEKVTQFTAEHIVWFSTTNYIQLVNSRLLIVSDIKYTEE